MEELKFNTSFDLNKKELTDIMERIKEFGRSSEFFHAMNNFGLKFEEEAILLTWIIEKTTEGLKTAESMEG